MANAPNVTVCVFALHFPLAYFLYFKSLACCFLFHLRFLIVPSLPFACKCGCFPLSLPLRRVTYRPTRISSWFPCAQCILHPVCLQGQQLGPIPFFHTVIVVTGSVQFGRSLELFNQTWKQWVTRSNMSSSHIVPCFPIRPSRFSRHKQVTVSVNRTVPRGLLVLY